MQGVRGRGRGRVQGAGYRDGRLTSAGRQLRVYDDDATDISCLRNQMRDEHCVRRLSTLKPNGCGGEGLG